MSLFCKDEIMIYTIYVNAVQGMCRAVKSIFNLAY